jgi:transcriptional regulator with XRE-family HTH domain
MTGRDKKDDLFLKKLGERIKTIRLEKGITQVALAHACDIEGSNMRRIEAGNTNPTALMLLKICGGLGIELKELFDF